jgi:hypothetical protein
MPRRKKISLHHEKINLASIATYIHSSTGIGPWFKAFARERGVVPSQLSQEV